MADGGFELTPVASPSLGAIGLDPPLPFLGVDKHAIVQVQMSAERFHIYFANVAEHFLQQHDEVQFFVQNPHHLGGMDAEQCYSEYFGFIDFLLELNKCPCKFMTVNLADLRKWFGPEEDDIAIEFMNEKLRKLWQIS